MIARASPLFDVQDNKDYGISRDEFMGVMAETEFYNFYLQRHSKNSIKTTQDMYERATWTRSLVGCAT